MFFKAMIKKLQEIVFLVHLNKYFMSWSIPIFYIDTPDYKILQHETSFPIDTLPNPLTLAMG